MRVDILAYMIYLEGHDCPEYVMHIFFTKSLLGPQVWEDAK